jgi:hypothetical protein
MEREEQIAVGQESVKPILEETLEALMAVDLGTFRSFCTAST